VRETKVTSAQGERSGTKAEAPEISYSKVWQKT